MTTVVRRASGWSASHALDALRIAFGILFLWLGVLKVLPGVSPAEPLMRAAMPAVVPIDMFIRFAAAWEILIGFGFITGRLPRLTMLMTFATMCTTLSIPWLAPELVWRAFPFVLTFEGEYVVKDIVIAASALVLAARLDGGHAAAVRTWAMQHSLTILKMAFGAVFVAFGALKVVPGTSALEPWSRMVVPIEQFSIFYSALGVWEMLVGIALMTRGLGQVAVACVLVFSAVTSLSVVVRPDLTFGAMPGVLTLLGQHLLKNLIFAGAALVLLTRQPSIQLLAGERTR